MGTRPITTAEILAVGSELLVGETRDTNSGDLAVELTALGVEVQRINDLPDRQAVLVDSLRSALARSDLVITSGGLGPTPDDLTREAIAEALGEEPSVDPELEAWLRHFGAAGEADGRPRTVSIVHGDPDAAEAFATRIRDELGLVPHVAAHHETVTLA